MSNVFGWITVAVILCVVYLLGMLTPLLWMRRDAKRARRRREQFKTDAQIEAELGLAPTKIEFGKTYRFPSQADGTR